MKTGSTVPVAIVVATICNKKKALLQQLGAKYNFENTKYNLFPINVTAAAIFSEALLRKWKTEKHCDLTGVVVLVCVGLWGLCMQCWDKVQRDQCL